MKIILSLLMLTVLAACGVAGAPERPTTTGVTITGEASIGVTGSN